MVHARDAEFATACTAHKVHFGLFRAKVVEDLTSSRSVLLQRCCRLGEEGEEGMREEGAVASI